MRFSFLTSKVCELEERVAMLETKQEILLEAMDEMKKEKDKRPKDLNAPSRWNMRIWDDYKKEWLCLSDKDALTYYGFDITGGKVVDSQGLPKRHLGRHLIWEQSTGIKDIYGKEIYEGDIVRTTNRVTVKGLIFPIGVVEFKQRAFWICNVPSERPDFTHNETLLQYWETDLEVIGNIHENPELLGEEE